MTIDRTTITGTHFFDLNIEKVLEHWPVEFAIREVIANALDEWAITDGMEPRIVQIGGDQWRIVDFGRGLRYQHLTQKENQEKRNHPDVIGQFGMGLKDALAVFHRRNVEVEIYSPHGDVTTVMRPKEGFADVVTLHAAVRPPSQPGSMGTEVVLSGVTDEQVSVAKRFFLRYSDDVALETTSYGTVLARPDNSGPARVYVKGLLVAEEENFLFSYNITDVNAPLRKALNRERSNVGRTAYTDRVKAILKKCTSPDVARPLAADLAGYVRGTMHDELEWKDVTLHACRVLATHERVVFVTAGDLEAGSPQLQYARDDGYRLVTVPEDIYYRLGDLTDLDGGRVLDLGAYRESWNDSFQFQFVDATAFTEVESAVYGLTGPTVALANLELTRIGVSDVVISETMRLNETGSQVLGLFDPENRRIIIRRDQLSTPLRYCGTLLHELIHAASGTTDGTMEFESALTQCLGVIASNVLRGGSPSRSTTRSANGRTGLPTAR
jgi:hypothetical protein